MSGEHTSRSVSHGTDIKEVSAAAAAAAVATTTSTSSNSNIDMKDGKPKDNEKSTVNKPTATNKKNGDNKERKLRRARNASAMINDLCEIVADLFVAESKLLNPSSYGIENHHLEREEVVANVRDFVDGLPSRYALSVESPSEVLLHMRLMAAAKSDHARAVVHISNHEENDAGGDSGIQGSVAKHQVTIVCFDEEGLLEYITKILGTGGARVLDADVMLSKDGIVLVRVSSF